MSFEDRIKSAVDQAAGPLVKQILAEADAEREAAIRDAKVKLYEEAELATQTRVADAEARVRATMEEKHELLRAGDRADVERETRKQLEIEFDAKMREALEAAQNRMRIALADGEAKAAADLRTAVADARVNEREIEMAGVSRLLESVRGLDGATTLSEVHRCAVAGGGARGRPGRRRRLAERSHPGLAPVGIRPARRTAEINRSRAQRMRRDRPGDRRRARGHHAR